MTASADFDAILDEIWGNGKYQKRLTVVLLGGVFFLMPFALLVQVFVLHMPGKYENIHIEGLKNIPFCYKVIGAHLQKLSNLTRLI